MELKEKTTVKIGENSYTNDVEARKIYKNDDIYKNYCIIQIEEDGTVIFKNNITIDSFNYNDIATDDPELFEVIQELQKPTKSTKKTKNTKEDAKEDEKTGKTNKK